MDENGELVLVQAWLNISSMSLKETEEGGLSSGVFLKKCEVAVGWDSSLGIEWG